MLSSVTTHLWKYFNNEKQLYNHMSVSANRNLDVALDYFGRRICFGGSFIYIFKDKEVWIIIEPPFAC